MARNWNPEVFGAKDCFWNVIQVWHPFLKVIFSADYDCYARLFQPFASKNEISTQKGGFAIYMNTPNPDD